MPKILKQFRNLAIKSLYFGSDIEDLVKSNRVVSVVRLERLGTEWVFQLNFRSRLYLYSMSVKTFFKRAGLSSHIKSDSIKN